MMYSFVVVATTSTMVAMEENQLFEACSTPARQLVSREVTGVLTIKDNGENDIKLGELKGAYESYNPEIDRNASSPGKVSKIDITKPTKGVVADYKATWVNHTIGSFNAALTTLTMKSGFWKDQYSKSYEAGKNLIDYLTGYNEKLREEITKRDAEIKKLSANNEQLKEELAHEKGKNAASRSIAGSVASRVTVVTGSDTFIPRKR